MGWERGVAVRAASAAATRHTQGAIGLGRPPTLHAASAVTPRPPSLDKHIQSKRKAGPTIWSDPPSR